MIIQAISGNVRTLPLEGKEIDVLPLEWFETHKRIQRKRSRGGQELALRFLQENPNLQEGDVLFMDASRAVIVEIQPCEAIVLTPATMLEMGAICYEIGNKHLPLFLQGAEVLVPYEDPLFRWLEAAGYAPVRAVRKLTNALRSNVTPHAHGDSGSSLLSKILNIASR
ncbi:MAG TPA: urease accessory protein UreE [Chitinophaga sp.]